MELKRLFLDLETTGTDDKIHGVHQISGQIEIKGVVVESFDFKCKPFEGAIIEREALEINGKYYEEELEKIMSYPDESIIYKEIDLIITRYINKFDKKDKFMIIGYNVKFDIQFLYQLYLRNDNKYLFSLIWGNYIDVMSLASEKLETIRPYMENFKLVTVAKTIGIQLEEEKLHDSLYDIEITRLMFYKITTGSYKIVDDVEEEKTKPVISKNIKDVFLKPDNSTQPKASSGGNQSFKTLKKINDESYIFTFGKYKGLAVSFIIKSDPQYLIWAHDNTIQGVVVSKDILSLAFQQIKNLKDNEKLNNGTRPNLFEQEIDDDLPF